jgi:quinol monooxygenase YgiN
MSTRPSTRPITVVVIFEARPGKETELRRALLSLISATRKEIDCISYDIHFCLTNPAKFFLYENWLNKKSYYAHLKSAHIMAATPWIEQQLCVSPPEVAFWEKIS